MTSATTPLEFWSTHSVVKCPETAARPAGAGQEMRLRAARGEYEAAQLVLRSAEPLQGVTVSVGALATRHGAVIAQQNIELRQGVYVPTPLVGGSYPDPLPPLRDLTLTPGKNAPVYIIVHVPRDAHPGEYEAPVRIRWPGGSAETRLALTVWNVTLPQTPSCVTAFGYIKDHILHHHKAKAGTPEAENLFCRYFEMLLDYGISPYHIPVPYTSPRAARYFDDPRLTSYVIEHSGNDETMATTISLLKKQGWWKKGFFYVVDEPVKADAFAQLHESSQRLKRLAPDARIVSPFYRRPEHEPGKTIFDLAGGDVNIWCTNTHHYDLDTTVCARFHEMRAAKDHELWWYVCCGPGKPYCNFFIDQTGMEHRMLMWQQKKARVQGLLYWCTTWWNPNKEQGTGDDPWTEMTTVKDINPKLYGDGSLLYPGSKVGIAGPVPSVRLLTIRDGVEDFDLLTLLENKRGTKVMQEYVGRLVTSMTEYSQDPAQLEAVRADIAAELTRNS